MEEGFLVLGSEVEVEVVVDVVVEVVEMEVVVVEEEVEAVGDGVVVVDALGMKGEIYAACEMGKKNQGGDFAFEW